MTDTKRTPVISLGAGVQSTVLTLMAAEGRFGPVPELAIFADTGDEPPGVYQHLEWLRAEVAGTIEVVTCTHGNLLEQATTAKFNPIPVFMRRKSDGRKGIGRRQCTKDFKLRPIRAEMRRRGFSERHPVDMWLGISIDEVARMKPTGLKWVANSWPLVEQRISRNDCKAWFAERYPGRTLTKSSCVYCPYRRPRDWIRMRETDPESWAKAVAADEAMRDAGNGYEAFLSDQFVPLPLVETIESKGQLTLGDFDGECEGMCGV